MLILFIIDNTSPSLICIYILYIYIYIYIYIYTYKIGIQIVHNLLQLTILKAPFNDSLKSYFLNYFILLTTHIIRINLKFFLSSH